MGSPLGPLLADIFMAHAEKQLETQIEELRLYRRFVDDILLVSVCQSKVNTLLNDFNNVHKNIRLTAEQEKNNEISLLDILITRRNDGSIKR